MTEAHENIRASLLNTLSFLASQTQQQEFAAKVFYDSYQDEFACWWFDTFFPNEQDALEMFTAKQIAILRRFTNAFENCLKTLGSGPLRIEQLHAKAEWQSLIVEAQATVSDVENAI